MNDDITKLRKLYKLKNIYRANSVGNRKESSAEHTWSALMLADYFIDKIYVKIDRLKVFELLMYHDVVEIEAGDIPIHHVEKRKNKKINELKALEKLKKELPTKTGKKLSDLFIEFEESDSVEAKFAKIIDAFDAIIHELDYKEDWKCWTEEMVRGHHEERFKHFPELRKTFEDMIEYLNKNGYFKQR